MRPFTSTIPFSDALRMAIDAAQPVTRTEHVPLAEADGRVAAETVQSPIDVPPFSRSAMDGYAVHVTAETRGPGAALTCIGRVFTGEMFTQPIDDQHCVEIATGAPLPPGANAVVMVEETTRSGDIVSMRAAIRQGQNIGRRGADIAAGDDVVGNGQTMTPSRVGALAAAGHRGVTVFAKPTVAIVSTGNEVVQPGLPLAPGHIYDINRFTLESVVRRHGGAPVALASPGDSLPELERILDAAAAYDLIVFSGGSSVGDRDLVRDVIASRGEMIFHGIGVKPGKPTALARIGTSLFLGMPGNPTSCLSNAYILLVPVLRKMAGLSPWEPRTVAAPLARRIVSISDRHQFYTVRIVNGAAEAAFKGSGDITSMAQADGYIEIPASTDVIEAGTMVTVTLF